jgi:hypothetical protein
MNRYIFLFSLLIFGAFAVPAEETYIFKDKSKIYDVKVSFEKCDADEDATICSDKAKFYLMKKNELRIFQAIELDETYLYFGGKRETKAVSELAGGDTRGVYFADYNFDGIEDLALSNGNYLPYGGISYNVYLFSKTAGKFVLNLDLTKLESEKMSVEVNAELKYIEAQTKAGCCWHERARYRFVNNRLQKFYSFTEDAMSDGKWMTLITGRRVRGRWRRTTKRVLIKRYYKEN